MEGTWNQNGGQMEAKIAPKSLKRPPGGVSEATFCENGRPSPNTAISVRIAHLPSPESSMFAPFGPKSRPKALLERHQKNVSKQMPKSLQKSSKWSPKRVRIPLASCWLRNGTLEPEGARRCPGALKTSRKPRISAPLWTTFGVLLTTLWSLFSRRVFDASLEGLLGDWCAQKERKGSSLEGSDVRSVY